MWASFCYTCPFKNNDNCVIKKKMDEDYSSTAQEIHFLYRYCLFSDLEKKVFTTSKQGYVNEHLPDLLT